MKIIKINKKIILISIFTLLVVFIISIFKIINNSYINFKKLKKDFENLKQELFLKGYKTEIYNSQNLIVVERDNMKIYFRTKWIKTKFDDTITLSEKYKIKDLVINSNGRFSKHSYYIEFKSCEIDTNRELNNYFDFNFINIERSSIRTGFPSVDDALSESYLLFKNKVMSDIELNNYCNEAKSLERFLAYKY